MSELLGPLIAKLSEVASFTLSTLQQPSVLAFVPQVMIAHVHDFTRWKVELRMVELCAGGRQLIHPKYNVLASFQKRRCISVLCT
jgi:hypothetical protein